MFFGHLIPFFRCEGSFCSIEGMCIGPIPSIMQCTPEPGFDFEVAEAGLCREAATDCPPRHCCKFSRCLPFGCCDDDLCLSDNNYANGTTPNLYLGKIDCHRGRREAEIQVANFIDSQDRNRCACTCNGTDPWALVASDSEVEDTICGQLVDANVEVTYDEADGGCLCSCTPVIKFSWTEWTEWTSCSVTCGLDGKQTRTRDCLGDDGSTSNQCGTDDTTELDIRGCDPVPENCIIGKKIFCSARHCVTSRWYHCIYFRCGWCLVWMGRVEPVSEDMWGLWRGSKTSDKNLWPSSTWRKWSTMSGIGRRGWSMSQFCWNLYNNNK